MRHVCVSYSAQTFGDWLRYFIALHDGFERFKLEENYGNYDLPSHYYRHELLPPRSVNLSDVFDVEYFISNNTYKTKQVSSYRNNRYTLFLINIGMKYFN